MAKWIQIMRAEKLDRGREGIEWKDTHDERKHMISPKEMTRED